MLTIVNDPLVEAMSDEKDDDDYLIAAGDWSSVIGEGRYGKEVLYINLA